MDVLTACHQALVADLWAAVVSAFTAPHLERVRLTNIAIAEVLPGVRCVPNTHDNYETLFWPHGVPLAERVKAGRLALMAVRGPEWPETCDAHKVQNRPDIWDECGKVSVASALLGRTCWKAQP